MPAALRDSSPASLHSGLEQEFAFSAQDFERVRRLIYDHAGINLHAGKQAMVYSRLSRRLRETGHRSFSDYLGWLQQAHDSAARSEWQQFVNGLTTNLTSFFREAHHFECLAQDLRERQGRDLRIWSAAASTGEEPYSIAMVVDETLGAQARTEIVASDIDTTVLATAERGIYDAASRSLSPRACSGTSCAAKVPTKVISACVPRWRGASAFARSTWSIQAGTWAGRFTSCSAAM